MLKSPIMGGEEEVVASVKAKASPPSFPRTHTTKLL